ncbi:MAG: hypothetical protein E6X19_16990, partial [Hungatella hathewayi]|nr:hypothetical protein [Hungatella hathewayi]
IVKYSAISVYFTDSSPPFWRRSRQAAPSRMVWLHFLPEVPPLKTFRKNGTLIGTKQEQERYHAIERTTVPL